jgi:Arc/MetJ-type ribon-helix-helix transcriptional regulator
MYNSDVYSIMKEAPMVRTQIYLTATEKSRLASIAVRQGASQSDLIRKAVDELLEKHAEEHRISAIDAAAGIWKSRKRLPDIRKLRRGWRRRAVR